MPFRFRKSIKLFPGVRVNVGHKGISSVNVGRTNFRKGQERHARRFACLVACRGSLAANEDGRGGEPRPP